MFPFVNFERITIVATVVTLVTLETLYTCVPSLVNIQARLLAGLVIALVAFEGFFTGVFPLVNLEFVGATTPEVTLVTRVDLFSNANPETSVLRATKNVTHITCLRLSPHVGSLVNIQVLFVTEAAVAFVTFVWSFPCVRSNM